ncbi:MAG: hypothetical protein PVF51_06090 [Nitrospirota bacterium]|jgi:hypothetical protein
MKTWMIGAAASCLLAFTVPAMAQDLPFGACWGQASRVLAEMGEMGEHASQQSNPRAGLRNLARELYDEGVLVDDSLSALGQFVADELGLSIDACM